MMNKREIDYLRSSQIEEAYKAAREDFKGGLLRFMHMQFLEEVDLSDAQRLTAEMFYLRFAVNQTLLRDLQCEAQTERLFIDNQKKEVYISLSKLLSKAKACVPVYMRLMDAAYEKCSKLRDVSSYPRITDKRYTATLLEGASDFLAVAYCVLPSWEVEKLYASGLVRLIKVRDDVGVISDFTLYNSQLQAYTDNQAHEYLRVKRSLSGPAYHAWKHHRPASVACEYVLCGLRTDIETLLKN